MSCGTLYCSACLAPQLYPPHQQMVLKIQPVMQQNQSGRNNGGAMGGSNHHDHHGNRNNDSRNIMRVTKAIMHRVTQFRIWAAHIRMMAGGVVVILHHRLGDTTAITAVATATIMTHRMPIILSGD